MTEVCDLKTRIESLEMDLSLFENRTTVAEGAVDQKNAELAELRTRQAIAEQDFARRRLVGSCIDALNVHTRQCRRGCKHLTVLERSSTLSGPVVDRANI